METAAVQTTMDFVGQLTTPAAVREYMTAGRATITIRSKITGNRFTYKISKKKDQAKADDPIWWVNLLRGPDNESDFTYMGIIKKDFTYMGIIKKESLRPHYFTLTAASKVSADALSVKAFQYVMNHIFGEVGIAALTMPKDLEVWHEGSCGRCGRKLTVPESIANGIGPECIKKM